MRNIKEDEVVMIPIPFKRTWKQKENGAWSGSMTFRFADTCVDITDSDGNKKGAVEMGIGASLDLNIDGDNATRIRARAKDIWNAYVEFMEKEEMKIE